MPKRKHTAEEIINKLRKAEVIIANPVRLETVVTPTRRLVNALTNVMDVARTITGIYWGL